MTEPRTLFGHELAPAVQRECLRRFVHRMTHENAREHPGFVRWMQSKGYRLPLCSDAEWLRRTRFYVRADGQLDGRRRYCETTQGAQQ